MLVVLGLVSAAFALIGLRLLRTALPVRGAEGWLGLAFLCVAASMPIRGLLANGLLADSARTLLFSHALMAAGLCAFTLFVDRVFRPDDGWAIAVTAVLVALQIATLPALVFFGGHRSEQSVVSVLIGLSRALPFVWAFWESRRYHRQMCRRGELGLADPVVTNRFGLFATWTGALSSISIGVSLLRLYAVLGTESGRMLSDDPTSRGVLGLVVGVLAIAGTAAAAALWLSFFPPQAWLERIRAQQPAAV